MRDWLRSLVTLLGCTALLLVSPVPAAADGPATIDLSPTSGTPGTLIIVSGLNWTHPSWASGVPINIYQNYGNGNLKRLAEGNSGPPNRDGKFSVQMTIPTSAEVGLVTVSTLTGGGYAPSAGFTVTGAQVTQPTLEVDRAFTTNGTTTEKTAFALGDSIWYVVSMNVKNGPARATVQWRTVGTREIYNYTSKPSDINSGYQAPYAPATIPKDAPPDSYTLTAYVTFNGSTTTRTSTFRVSRHEAEPKQLNLDVDGFMRWLNACVEGQLDFDPSCKEAAHELAGVSLNPASLAECLKDIKRVTEATICGGQKIIAVIELFMSHGGR